MKVLFQLIKNFLDNGKARLEKNYGVVAANIGTAALFFAYMALMRRQYPFDITIMQDLGVGIPTDKLIFRILFNILEIYCVALFIRGYYTFGKFLPKKEQHSLFIAKKYLNFGFCIILAIVKLGGPFANIFICMYALITENAVSVFELNVVYYIGVVIALFNHLYFASFGESS